VCVRILAKIMVLGLVSVLHAGASIAGHDIVQSPADTAQPNSSPQRATEKNERKNSPCSENDAPSGEESTVRNSQDRSPPGRSCLCRPVVPANESLRDKFTRIFFGPDWCGPDPDVDTSISAGGAAGH